MMKFKIWPSGNVTIVTSTLHIKKHIKSCFDIAIIAYIFEIDKIITFQDKLKYMGDLPFTV